MHTQCVLLRCQPGRHTQCLLLEGQLGTRDLGQGPAKALWARGPHWAQSLIGSVPSGPRRLWTEALMGLDLYVHMPLLAWALSGPPGPHGPRPLWAHQKDAR